MSETLLLETTAGQTVDALEQTIQPVIIAPDESGQQEQSRFTILGKEHARQIAGLHIEGINTGFISSLGLDFVTALYEGIVESRQSYGFVTDDGRLVGFVAFTTNVGKLYKSVVLRKGLRFGFLLARKMFSFKRIKKILETLLYPSKVKKLNFPSAELLSIVITPEARGYGRATELVTRGLEEYRKLGIDKVKVLVAAANEPANRLYKKCGFELIEQVSSHGVPSNIYVATIAEAKPARQSQYAERYSGLRWLQYAAEQLQPAAAAIAVALAHLFRS
jgi:ribosomal protein S18 acetylase RimI-like enzyme